MPDSDKHSSAKPIVKPKPAANASGGGGGGGGVGSQPTTIVLDGGSGSGSVSGSGSLGDTAMAGAGGGGGGLKIGVSGDVKDMGSDGPTALPMGTPSSLTDRYELSCCVVWVLVWFGLSSLTQCLICDLLFCELLGLLESSVKRQQQRRLRVVCSCHSVQ